MYSIECNEMVYWFQSEDAFEKAVGGRGCVPQGCKESRMRRMRGLSDVALNMVTREVVKCRYDMREIVSSWMYRRSHECKMAAHWAEDA